MSSSITDAIERKITEVRATGREPAAILLHPNDMISLLAFVKNITGRDTTGGVQFLDHLPIYETSYEAGHGQCSPQVALVPISYPREHLKEST